VRERQHEPVPGGGIELKYAAVGQRVEGRIEAGIEEEFAQRLVLHRRCLLQRALCGRRHAQVDAFGTGVCHVGHGLISKVRR
jgi:hypothetical protein